MLRRVLLLALVGLLPVVPTSPADALSCAGITKENVLNAPGAFIGHVVRADLKTGRVRIEVETPIVGDYTGRVTVPSWGMGWDDWNGEAMRTGPVLFLLHEGENGILTTGGCSFSLDPALIAEARALVPKQAPQSSAADDSEPWLPALGSLAALILLAAGLAARRRPSS